MLSDRDKEILWSLKNCRYLLTSQIQRLHFIDSVSATAALRSANRTMTKLKDYGMVESLQRRIGGVRAGSGSYVWTLAESGANLLHLNDADYSPRKRNFEPSLNFLKHTLEVSEAFIQLTEICRKNKLELLKTEMEPVCWRAYTGENGKPASMKPDMFAITANAEFEDNWFIEIDMNTESPCVVMEKCRRYAYYCKTGREQQEYGVFPLVVWIVGSVNRKNNLLQHIADSREIPELSKNIFTVIMPDELEALVCNGKEGLI